MWTVAVKCLEMIGGTSTRMSFSQWQQSVKEADDWISGGKLFQSMDAATGNERRPTVARRCAGTCSRCDEDERRRWRPGRSATRTSWSRYGGDRPFSAQRDRQPDKHMPCAWNEECPSCVRWNYNRRPEGRRQTGLQSKWSCSGPVKITHYTSIFELCFHSFSSYISVPLWQHNRSCERQQCILPALGN